MFKKTLLILMASSLFACTAKKSENEVVIGHYASMTGGEATFGQSDDNGMRLAVDEINNAGGVKGKKIKMITLDDQGKVEDTASVVNRLLEQENVVALLGEVASQRSLLAAPLAQARKIPMISPSSTNPKVTEVGDYIFRVCFIDSFQGTVMAKFARENLKVKKIAVLRDVGSDYSVGLSDFFISKFKELGGEVVADMSYQHGDVDFKGQLTQVKSKNPEAIYIPGYYTEVGLIARQARELGLKISLLGGDGWDSPKLFEIGQEAINGSYFSTHYSSETKEPTAVEFLKNYKTAYGRAPDGLSAMGYDAVKVLYKAMQNAPDLTPAQIRDELAKIKDFQGVTGNITIDEKRNAKKSAVIVQVEGNNNRFITTVNP